MTWRPALVGPAAGAVALGRGTLAPARLVALLACRLPAASTNMTVPAVSAPTSTSAASTHGQSRIPRRAGGGATTERVPTGQTGIGGAPAGVGGAAGAGSARGAGGAGSAGTGSAGTLARLPSA